MSDYIIKKILITNVPQDMFYADQGFEDMLVDNNVGFDPVDLSTFINKYDVEEDLEIIKHEDKEISVLIDFESWCSWNREMQEFWLSAL